MARVMTTPEHFEMFAAMCRKWLEVLGIRSYIISFYHKPSDCFAKVRVRVNRRSARFTLAKYWPSAVTPAELERCALHESLHVLMAQLCAEALPVDSANDAALPANYKRIDREEEAVVVTLENVITKLWDAGAHIIVRAHAH